MMRAANQSVTDGTIAFSGSNTVKSSGTRTTTGRTVTGMPIVCKSTGNDTNAPQAYVAAMQSGTVISFFDSGNTEFEFQKVKGLSITKAQEWGTLTYNFSYTLTDGTSGTTSNQPSHTTTGMVYYNLATICGGNLAKLSINCVSAVGNAYISDIVLTYDCGPVYLDSIDITTAPTKTSYYVGETFDPTGMVVTATYTSGSTSTVSGYTYSTSPLTLDDKEIEISYTEGGITKTTTQEITVETAPVLQSIAVTTAPTKTTYTEGDYFDPAGMVVTATYDKGPTQDVTSECSFSPSTSTALATSDEEITISYSGMTTTQAITVNPIPILSTITISGYTTSFDVGDHFSFDGIVTAHYINAADKVVTNDVTFSPIDLGDELSASDDGKTITVSYTENEIVKTATYIIEVSAASFDGVYEGVITGTIDRYMTLTLNSNGSGVYTNSWTNNATPRVHYEYNVNITWSVESGGITITYQSFGQWYKDGVAQGTSSYAGFSQRMFAGGSAAYVSGSLTNDGTISSSTPFVITIKTYSSNTDSGTTRTLTKQ